MGRKEYDAEDMLLVCFLTIMATLVFCAIMIAVTAPDIRLDQEVADDICQQLTGNETAVAIEGKKDNYHKLVCELPSFDSTQNIIFKTNGDED